MNAMGQPRENDKNEWNGAKRATKMRETMDGGGKRGRGASIEGMIVKTRTPHLETVSYGDPLDTCTLVAC